MQIITSLFISFSSRHFHISKLHKDKLGANCFTRFPLSVAYSPSPPTSLLSFSPLVAFLPPARIHREPPGLLSQTLLLLNRNTSVHASLCCPRQTHLPPASKEVRDWSPVKKALLQGVGCTCL